LGKFQTTASVHPKLLDRFEPENDLVVARLRTAVSALQAAGQRIEAAQAANDANKLATPLANQSATRKFAQQTFQRVAPTVDAARRVAVQAIAELEQNMAAPLAKAGRSGHEMREVLRGMSGTDRHTFLAEAVERGDTDLAGSALGVHSALSGLKPTAHTSLAISGCKS
jgi:hypothetical protein